MPDLSRQVYQVSVFISVSPTQPYDYSFSNNNYYYEE